MDDSQGQDSATGFSSLQSKRRKCNTIYTDVRIFLPAGGDVVRLAHGSATVGEIGDAEYR